jgi:hypothetical protein
MTLKERAVLENIVLATGLDYALIGFWSPVLSDRVDNQDKTVAVYNINLITKRYMEQDGMTYEEAMDFFQYNVVDVFTENHPIFIEA